MRTKVSRAALVVVASLLFFPFASSSRSCQAASQVGNVQDEDPKLKPSKRSGVPPRAAFGALTPENAAQRIQREKRESKRRNFYRPISDPGRLVDGDERTTTTRIYEQSGELDSFPASQAALVVVGRVTSGQGYVSSDRTYVYSDFQIAIDEVLKQDESAKVSVGATLIASRPGATVEFPSGHIRRFVIEKQGMPKIGSKYLLFLQKAAPDLPEYEIIRGGAYEILLGKAYPLDDFHPKLEGVDEASLIGQAKTAIRGGVK